MLGFLISASKDIAFWVDVAQAVATVLAIIVGGFLAWRNGLLFRHGKPHVNISHEITHRPIGNNYVHLEITTILHNSSRVKIEFRDALSTIQQISPTTDAVVEELYSKLFLNTSAQSLDWTVLHDLAHSWNKNELIVEPGETVTVSFEYIVNRNQRCVLVTTHFYNHTVMGTIKDKQRMRETQPRRKYLLWWLRKSGPRGWNRTTAYDIMLGDE